MLTDLRIRGVGPCLLALMVISGIAFAAEPDLRLVNAAADQDWASVKALLKQKFDVSAARPDGMTPLLFAAHWNQLEMAEMLLRAGAKVNAADDNGVTPLSQAALTASVAMVETLLKTGADPNAAQISGLTPDRRACRECRGSQGAPDAWREC
jgi:uncharacterized protein